jgi:hypothetical protein
MNRYNSGLLYFKTEENTVLTYFKAITMSQDGEYLIIGGEKGTVYIYRAYDLSLAYTYPSCDAIIRSLAITHDQK